MDSLEEELVRLNTTFFQQSVDGIVKDLMQ